MQCCQRWRGQSLSRPNYWDLGGRDQYSFKKPNPNLNNSTETNSDPASSDGTVSPSTNKKKTNVMHNNRMPPVFKFGFSTKITKKEAEKIRERDKRETRRKKQKLENCMVTMYHFWRCLNLIIVSLDAFCQIISPPLPTIWKRYAGGRIFLGIMSSVNTLKTPMDNTRLLAAIKCLVMRILG